MDWKVNNSWSCKHAAEVSSLLRKHANVLLSPTVENATFEQDTTEATDLVMKCSNVSIQVRVRRANYERYWPEITLRSRCKSGGETEVH